MLNGLPTTVALILPEATPVIEALGPSRPSTHSFRDPLARSVKSHFEAVKLEASSINFDNQSE